MSPSSTVQTSSAASPEELSLEGTRYRFLRHLGRGGMGTVVLAEHRVLGKPVAIKLLHANLADSALAARFRAEARTLSQLEHPTLVKVHDLGVTPSGQPYYAMEALAGRTLQEELQIRGPLPLNEAVGIAMDILSGLAVAHAAGIVHRDIKPGNIFLAQRPSRREVKILDFGVAKVLSQLPSSTFTVPCTEVGTVIGSPRFISPEQALAKAVDARTDIYAMGLLLYSMVAGCGPFDHLQGAQNILRAHVGVTPTAPSFYRKDLPKPLEAVILKAMAKQPEDRFPSANALIEALRGALGLGAGSPLRTEPLDAPPTPSVEEGPPPRHALLPFMPAPSAQSAPIAAPTAPWPPPVAQPNMPVRSPPPRNWWPVLLIAVVLSVVMIATVVIALAVR